jgi:hypothetical protein
MGLAGGLIVGFDVEGVRSRVDIQSRKLHAFYKEFNPSLLVSRYFDAL